MAAQYGPTIPASPHDAEPGPGHLAPTPSHGLPLSGRARATLRAEVAAYRRELLAAAHARAGRRRGDVVSAVDVEAAADLLGGGAARTWLAHGAGMLVGAGLGGAVAVVQMDEPPLRLIVLTFVLLLLGGVAFGRARP